MEWGHGKGEKKEDNVKVVGCFWLCLDALINWIHLCGLSIVMTMELVQDGWQEDAAQRFNSRADGYNYQSLSRGFDVEQNWWALTYIYVDRQQIWCTRQFIFYIKYWEFDKNGTSILDQEDNTCDPACYVQRAGQLDASTKSMQLQILFEVTWNKVWMILNWLKIHLIYMDYCPYVMLAEALSTWHQVNGLISYKRVFRYTFQHNS